MQNQRHIDGLNALLVSELGSSPRFAWKHSSELYMGVQKIVTGEKGPEPQYEYKANEHGIIELHPIYINMPMLPAFPQSWVLCRYVAADQESAFKQKFGARVEYPRNGIWQPIMPTIMAPDLVPTSTDTWSMIRAVREERVAIAAWLAKDRDDFLKPEEQASKRFGDMCRDAFTAGLDRPGTKGSTSFFSGSPSEPVVRKEIIQ